MKRNLIAGMVLLMLHQFSTGFAAFGKTFDTTISYRVTSHESGPHYLQKSKMQKTTGTGMIGAGMAAKVSSGLCEKVQFSVSQIAQTWANVRVTGFATTLTGMAFFKSSLLHKAVAKILLRSEKISPGAPNVSKKMMVVGIGLRF